MSFLHLLSNLSEAFGFVGRSIFRKLYFSFSAKRIDNVCDKVVTPSIKDNEPNIWRRGLDRHTIYKISGPVHKRLTDFLRASRNKARNLGEKMKKWGN